MIQVFASEDDNENDKVQLNLYNLKKKIVIQGSHKELWKDREFDILKTLVDNCIHNKDLSECYFVIAGVKINIECSNESDPSDIEEDEFPGEEARVRSHTIGPLMLLQTVMMMKWTLNLKISALNPELY